MLGEDVAQELYDSIYMTCNISQHAQIKSNLFSTIFDKIQLPPRIEIYDEISGEISNVLRMLSGKVSQRRTYGNARR